MRLAFVNPQGNFDPADSYLTAHPDFGGQLVYVREVALALAATGHQVDILTRRIIDPDWPEFAAAEDSYPGRPGVRVLRFPCGPQRFLPKEELWPHLGEWVDNIASWYRREGIWPDLWTGHYADGGLSAALLEEHSGVPFTLTSHSLGAWKLDRLLAPDVSFAAVGLPADELLPALDAHYNFGARVEAERAAMARAATIITNSNRGRYCLHDHPAYRDVVDVEDDRRFAVIPPGVNLAVFGADNRSPREGQILDAIAAALARDIVPERRGLPAVIAWSRLDPKKNHLALVRAFAHWPDLRERANLIMITRGLDDPLREPDAATPNEQAVLRPIVAEIEQADLWGCVSAFSLAGQDAAAALYRWGAQAGCVFCLPANPHP
jgi:sucrose-phosphate synthase